MKATKVGEIKRRYYQDRISWIGSVSESVRKAPFPPNLGDSGKSKPIFRKIGNDRFWIYKGCLYRAPLDLKPNEVLLLIQEQELKKTKKLKQLRKLMQISETLEKASSRKPIPEEVRMFVWRRDKVKCVECGSRENLEFDHIIPVSKGGANTARNIQLLCEACNRSKSDKI